MPIFIKSTKYPRKILFSFFVHQPATSLRRSSIYTIHTFDSSMMFNRSSIIVRRLTHRCGDEFNANAIIEASRSSQFQLRNTLPVYGEGICKTGTQFRPSLRASFVTHTRTHAHTHKHAQIDRQFQVGGVTILACLSIHPARSPALGRIGVGKKQGYRGRVEYGFDNSSGSTFRHF